MRLITTFVLIISTYFGFAGGSSTPIYVLKTIGNVEGIVFYDSGKIETNNPISGMTYQPRDSQRDYVTGTNSSVVFSLADDVVVGIEENSEFKLHTSTVDVINNQGSPPSKAVFTNKNHVASLMNGMIDVINLSSNGVFLLQTPRVTITIKQGRCRVIVQGKTTIVASMEGSVILHKLVDANLSSVSQGKYAYVSTYYSLTGKGIDLMNNGKATAIVRPIDADDLKKMTDSFDENIKLHDGSIYIVDGNRIIGVKIR